MELAHQLGADARLPTMKELSASLQVSVMTLNRALSELEAQGVIYRKQGSGTYVAPGIGQRNIGLVYDRDIFSAGASPFCSMLVEEARKRAVSGREKFSFYLAMPSQQGHPVHDDLVDALRGRRLNGVLFVGESNPEALHWLLEQEIPVVALAYTPIAPWRVKIDHAEGVRLGAEALIAQGCRRLGLWIPIGNGIGRQPGHASFPELDAFQGTLKKHKLPFHPELVWRNDELTDSVPAQATETEQEQGIRAATEVFGTNGAPTLPDGIVIDDDTMTRGALIALGRLGIQPGVDIKIASHTNRGSTVLQGYEDNLTLFEIDPSELVRAMYEMLETLIQGGTPSVATINVKPRLRA